MIVPNAQTALRGSDGDGETNLKGCGWLQANVLKSNTNRSALSCNRPLVAMTALSKSMRIAHRLVRFQKQAFH